MRLNEKVDFYGVFSVKCLNKNNEVIDEYTEKNLIMNNARTNMAELIAGVTANAAPINRFVLGTAGHIGTDILNPKLVGGPEGFTSTRTLLFSEDVGGLNYRIDFNADGGLVVEDLAASGSRWNGATPDDIPGTDPLTNIEVTPNAVRREVSGQTVTYTITIPADNANSNVAGVPAIAYTEAALYAGDDIFSMKTFPARVKEDTVSFEITWSIIF
jgi:hypothetical protein